MKKLMIAAAAAAMIGGVYATTGCEDCSDHPTDPAAQCTVEAYNVKFSLKTLAWKVLNADCPGTYMEQGTRTLEGLLYSCCRDCDMWDASSNNNFDYTLWEKANTRCFTDGLYHNNSSQAYVTNYLCTYTAQHYLVNKEFKASAYDYLTSDAAKAAGEAKTNTLNQAVRNAKVVTYVDTDPQSTTFGNWKYVYSYTGYLDVAGETAAKKGTKDAAFNEAKANAKGIYNLTGDLVDGTEDATYTDVVTKGAQVFAGYHDSAAAIEAFRFSKKATKVEAFWTIDTANDGAGIGTSKSDEGNGNPSDVQLWAAGFGTVTTDKDSNGDAMVVIKSLSGNCAGKIEPISKSADCEGQVATMCADEIDWCNGGNAIPAATIGNTFASGTWTLKYIKTLKNGIWGAIPAWCK